MNMNKRTYEALKRFLAELGGVEGDEVFSSQGWDLNPEKAYLFDDLQRVYGWIDRVAIDEK